MTNVTWKTGDNRVVVTIKMGTKEVNLDGHIATTSDIKVTATVNGAVVGTGRPEGTMHPVAVAKIGKLGMVQSNLDRINSVISDLEKTDDSDLNYDAMTESMNKMMNI